MVRTILLIRHAAAQDSSPDFERSLTFSGERDARHLGRWILEHHPDVDHMICSTARRAQSTAEIIEEQLKISGLEEIQDLYEASLRTMLSVVNSIDNEYHKVIIVAHNPTISYFADFLTSADLPGMDTGSAVLIEFSDVNWDEVSQNSGIFKYYYSPKSES